MAKKVKDNGTGTVQEHQVQGAGHGLLSATGDGSFPASLLKANEDFHSAIANSYIRDEEQRNNIEVYASQLCMFEMTEELEDPTNFLNGGLSINMAARAQGLQAHVGMVFPSISGMKVSKDEMKAMAQANVERAKRGKDKDGKEGED